MIQAINVMGLRLSKDAPKILTNEKIQNPWMGPKEAMVFVQEMMKAFSNPWNLVALQ